jgi:hypothetical protein
VVDFNPLITLVNLKQLAVFNDESHPRSIAVDLLSEVARRTKQLPAGSFQLETLQVDSISAMLVAPICSLLAAILHELVISYDQRVESLTEEEEKSLQLLTSLQYLGIVNCPGLPSLPQGLHSLSSLRDLRIEDCPEIQSLPNGGLPSSLNRIYLTACSDELHKEVTKLEGTNPELRVYSPPARRKKWWASSRAWAQTNQPPAGSQHEVRLTISSFSLDEIPFTPTIY